MYCNSADSCCENSQNNQAGTYGCYPDCLYLPNQNCCGGPFGPAWPAAPRDLQGIPWPAVTARPANGLNAYGILYSTTPQTLNLTAGETVQIPLATGGPAKNTAYVPVNGIVVTNTGIYEINYAAALTAALATTILFSVRVNGAKIPSATISRALEAGTGSLFIGNTIVALTAGSVVDLSLSAPMAVGITLNSGVNATLTVKQLD